MIRKSCKGSPCLAYLEAEIDKLTVFQNLSRNDKTNMAIEKSEKYSHSDLMKTLKDLKSFKSKVPAEIKVPPALMIFIDEDLEDEVKTFESKLTEKNEIKIIQTRLEIELLWFILLIELRKDAAKIEETDASASVSEDITLPELSAIFTEMMLYDKDSEEMKEIRKILVNWRNSR